jgi:hypothetical protein
VPARDERGQVGGLEGLVFGVLVFVFGTLLVANAWGVIDAKLAATSAAREAARAYVEAPAGSDAEVVAVQAGREAIAAHGRRPERATITADPLPRQRHSESRYARCARAVATVEYVVPLIAVPLLGQAGNGITVRARHSEVVDPYRSGLAGTAACDAG